MKRNPRKVGWTKAFRRAHNKDLTVDTTIALEQRRNRPEKYNRERMFATLKAIQRISEIREKREKQFYENRMKGKKKQEIEKAKRDLETGVSLIEAPEALIKRQQLEIKEKQEQKTKKKQQTT